MARPTQATFPDGSIFASDAAQIDQPDERWAAAYEGGEGKTPPAAGVHNYEFNRLDVFGQHLEKNGMADWDARTIYPLNGWAKGSDGMLYRSRLNGNVGNNPVGGDGSSWRSLSEIVSPQATESLAGIAEIATQAETSAGTDDARIVTPKKLRLGFSSSLTGSHRHVAFPTWLGGIVINWGTSGSMLPDDTASVTYSRAFTTDSYSLAVGSVYSSGGVGAELVALVDGKSPAGATFRARRVSGNNIDRITVDYIAIGK